MDSREDARGSRDSISPEIRDLLSWLGPTRRSPFQTNSLNESDSEILKLREDLYLAATTDSLSEEWQAGLYRDPWTLGWMCGTASLSDLAAVGADPLGLMLSVEWPQGFDLEGKSRFSQGFHAALEDSQTFLLGGDSGHSQSGAWGSTGLGTTARPPMRRTGLQPGWILGLSNSKLGSRLGYGPALGMRMLLGAPESDFPESEFRPRAELKLGQALLRAGVSVCIDTSDGLLSSLAILSEMNGQIGFALDWDENLLDVRARDYFQQLSFPLFSLWAFEHGDYQLLFAVPPEKWGELKELGLPIVRLGRTLDFEQDSLVRVDGRSQKLELTRARGLLNPESEQERNAPWIRRAERLFEFLREARLP